MRIEARRVKKATKKLENWFFSIERAIPNKTGAIETISVLSLAAINQDFIFIKNYGNLGYFLKFGFLFSLKASLPSWASSLI